MLISNSEINTFLNCQRKHFYSFRKGLAPRTHSKALTRGIVGHEALETYYTAKKNGASKNDCLAVALEVIDTNTDIYDEYTAELLQLRDVIRRYVEYYWDEPWSVLEVESQHEGPFFENVSYGMKLDLLVEVTAGREKGQIHLIDHKFVYDFWSDREIQMNAQLNKYIKTLRDNGFPVRKGILNQIRYRKLKDPKPDSLFRRDAIVLSPYEIESFYLEARKVAREINRLYQLTEEEHREYTMMRIDKETCGKCSFQPLCKISLQGQDTTRTEKAIYQRNTYLDQYREP